MQDINCMCVYRVFVNEKVTTLSTTLDFLITLVIIISGLILNKIYRKKLREEKRSRLPGRKGNVIEPIMSSYLILGTIFWPFEMTYLWINAHEIMPADWFRNCWLLHIPWDIIRVGRMIIVYNSFFAGMIRYLYIVHQQKSNQWDFLRVGRLFKIASFAVPMALEVIRKLSEEDFPGFKSTGRFQECMDFHGEVKKIPVTVAFAKQIFSSPLVHVMNYIYMTCTIVVGSNITEAYFYVKIFQTIERHVLYLFSICFTEIRPLV